MKPAPFDPCLLSKRQERKMAGLTGLATDDMLATGNEMFFEEKEIDTSLFDRKEFKSTPFAFWFRYFSAPLSPRRLCIKQ